MGIRKQLLLFYCPFVQKGWQPPVLSMEGNPNVVEMLCFWSLTNIEAYGYENWHEFISVGCKVTDATMKTLSRQVSLEAEICFGTTDTFCIHNSTAVRSTIQLHLACRNSTSFQLYKTTNDSFPAHLLQIRHCIHLFHIPLYSFLWKLQRHTLFNFPSYKKLFFCHSFHLF